jgi:hypothetical protein
LSEERSEERVERDLVHCEPLNEDVTFFVNPNLQGRLCDYLSEERVERDLVHCEPLNEDATSFVNPNLGIKSRVSCVLLRLLALLLLFTFLLSLAFIRSSLLGKSLVVLILLMVYLVAL